jgi:ACS family tartrate transporter-like MFS transporter
MIDISERAVLRKVTLRLIPFMFVLYIANYLDRINLSFAAETFRADLNFSGKVYGAGAGIFFLGYFLFEVPSNLILERAGARVWIARIMITWGVISSAMMFVKTPASFYALRFLLGVAEAGFFPGMIFYLTYWFPAAERAKAISRFMTATPMAGVIGAPLSTALLTYMPKWAAQFPPAFAALRGWQWLFLIEGIPSFLLGFVVLFYLTDRPEQAHWLTEEEKACLATRLNRERALQERRRHLSLLQAFADPRVILLSVIYFSLQIGFYGFNMWLPQIIKAFHGLSSLQAGLLSALPYVMAAIAMMVVGASSDRTGERRRHLAGAAFVGAAGMACSAFLHTPVLGVIALSVAALGMWSTLGPFWASPSTFLTGAAAAGGIAMINSIGNLGGFVGPYLMGAMKDATHTYTAGLLTLTLGILVAAILALTLPREPVLDSDDDVYPERSLP